MNCWHCKSELIWGGDHTFEDHGREGEGIVSNLSCQNCPTEVLVYYDIDKECVADNETNNNKLIN